jgi:hypothetical protein
MKIGCFHTVYENKKSTEFILQEFRKYNPDAPYTLVCDGGVNYYDIAKKYNCKYVHSYMRIGRRNGGHPSGIYGFTKDETLHWLHHFREAALHCQQNEATHMIMMEDDVLCKGKVNFNPEWEIAGFDTEGNKISPLLLDYLAKKYNVYPNVDWYGAGGGTIFKVSTFLENYHKMYDFIDFEFEHIIKHLDYRFGWLDLYMQILYFVCGKKYSVNPDLTEVWKTPNYMTSHHTLVHAYKEYYEPVNLGSPTLQYNEPVIPQA